MTPAAAEAAAKAAAAEAAAAAAEAAEAAAAKMTRWKPKTMIMTKRFSFVILLQCL